MATPDFEQIALSAITLRGSSWTIPTGGLAALQASIAEQLRLVWNARGAADIAMLEAIIPEAYNSNVDRALRSLDR